MDGYSDAHRGETLAPSDGFLYEPADTDPSEGEREQRDRGAGRRKRRTRGEDEEESSGRGFRQLERMREWRELRNRLSGDPFEEPLDDDDVWSLLDSPADDSTDLR